MSSPLSSLKKNKVPLFPGHMAGHRPIPFRHPEYSEDESRLLEEVTSVMVQEKRMRDPFVGLPQIKNGNAASFLPTPRSVDESGPNVDGYSDPPTDQDLMRMMMNKIAVLEQQVKSQNEEIRLKDRRIKVLEDKVKIVEKAQGQGSEANNSKDLQKHCLLLQQQVHEMETFLAEYGMVWVGEEDNENADVYINASIQVDDENDDEDNDNDFENNNTPTKVSDNYSNIGKNANRIWKPEKSFVNDNTSDKKAISEVNIDFDLLVENIRDLNVLAGEGVAQIKKTSDGARFQIPDPVQLTIYANGILMFNGPFRPYSDPTTQQTIKDILDGYFPSELQTRYPDGIPFLLTDLRGVTYQTKKATQAFRGEGQTLGGEKKPSRLIPSNYQDPVSWTSEAGTDTTSQNSIPTMTQSQFLNKLPKSVIKDGKVIDIRDSISGTLNGKCEKTAGQQSRPKSNISLVKTSVTKEMSECVANTNNMVVSSTCPTQNSGTSPPLDRPKSYTGHKDVTTLRVITENGDHTYIVKMKFQETIGNLRTYLDSHRRPKAPYDIVSTFPHKVHKNNTMTLEDSGLTPNAVLHLKPCI